MFTVTNKSGIKFAVIPVLGTSIVRVGNYSVGANNGGWSVFDWTRDQDVEWFESRIAALSFARKLVENSRRQDADAVRA